MTPAPQPKITLYDLLDAVWIALGLLTAGIAGVHLGVPWDVIVPLALTVSTGFVGRLVGKVQSRNTIESLRAYNYELTTGLAEALTKQSSLETELADKDEKLRTAAADVLTLRAQLNH